MERVPAITVTEGEGDSKSNPWSAAQITVLWRGSRRKRASVERAIRMALAMLGPQVGDAIGEVVDTAADMGAIVVVGSQGRVTNDVAEWAERAREVARTALIQAEGDAST